MNTYKIITLILTVLFAGNVLAEDLDTLKVVDVEEVLVIAAPKENRKDVYKRQRLPHLPSYTMPSAQGTK